MNVTILLSAEVVLHDDETADEIKVQLINELPDTLKVVERLSNYLINVDGEVCIEPEGHYEHVDRAEGDNNIEGTNDE